MISQLRKKVAGPKNRTKWEQYDLDFTYICDRIVAMAFPASGLEKAYRNSITDVASYLDEKHQGKYFIINVSNRQYNYENFENKVKQYEWNDHQAPTLDTLFQICYDSYTFLKEKPNTLKQNDQQVQKFEEKTSSSNKTIQDSVVCFHCNHGKGRTGTAIISFLLFTGFFKDSEEALKFYNKRRFSATTYGVDQPCQLRYLRYFSSILQRVKSLASQKIKINKAIVDEHFPLKAYYLQRIMHKGLSDDYSINISATRTQLSKHVNIGFQKQKQLSQIFLKPSCPLIGDLFIEITRKKWNSSKKVIARANINLFYLQELCSDKSEQNTKKRKYFMMTNETVKVSSSFEGKFQVTLVFQQYCFCHKKPDKQCMCEYEREAEHTLWVQMFGKAQIGATIPISEACKLLYIPYEISEELITKSKSLDGNFEKIKSV